MANNPNATDNLKPFVKGDPRINRHGRPKNFDALRKLAQLIGNELTNVKGVEMSRVEKELREWLDSRNPTLKKSFIEIGYGKVPDEVEVKSDNKITLRVVYDDKNGIQGDVKSEQ
jgi:hypothetical protein